MIVIGSGAGGAVGASYARALGKSVALFEKEEVLGGECPNWACIPTKALLQAAEVYQSAQNSKTFGVSTGKVGFHLRQMRAWKNLVVSRTGSAAGEKIFTDEGIHLIKGEARFVSPFQIDANGQTFRAKRYLIASGSETIIPPVEGLKEHGYITFQEAVELKKIPKTLLIIGGGPIGCEFAQLYSDLGVKVYLAEMTERLLIHDEPEAGELLAALFRDRGVEVMTKCQIKKIEKRYSKKIAHFAHGKTAVDEILVATGKKAVLSFGHEAAGIQVVEGKIRANAYLQTTNPRVYVAGDAIGPMQFTHTAAYQSRIAAHNAFARRRKVKPNYLSVARCTFTRPEVASVGLAEEEAKKRKIRVRTGVTPTAVLGRANTSNEFDGFVKIVSDHHGILVGSTIVAPRAGEMIHELALAIKLRATAGEVAEMVHAFPTYSEAVKIACANLN